jgi:hypothetical protein
MVSIVSFWQCEYQGFQDRGLPLRVTEGMPAAWKGHWSNPQSGGVRSAV